MLELVGNAPEIAQYLGNNVYGENIFLYNDVHMICQLIDSAVRCLTETNQLLDCKWEQAANSFSQCMPSDIQPEQ